MTINKLGSTVTIYGTLLVDDVPTEPNTLRLVITDPAGSTTSYIYGNDEEIVHVATGQFSFDLAITQRGTYSYLWYSNSSLTAFDGGSVEAAYRVTLSTLSDAETPVAIPFASFRVWDEEGTEVDLEMTPQRTGADGNVSIELPAGTYRFAASKLNWIFNAIVVDIVNPVSTVQLEGRNPSGRWLQWEDLEAIVDKATIDRLFNDTNDSSRDMVLVEQVIQQAETMAESNLLRSWTQAQIVTLAAGDPALRAQAAWLALEFASERRQEFIASDGKGRYWAQYERAMKFFETLSKSQNHSRGEANAGKGSNSGGEVRPILRPRQARRIFANEPDGSGHGGF